MNALNVACRLGTLGSTSTSVAKWTFTRGIALRIPPSSICMQMTRFLASSLSLMAPVSHPSSIPKELK